MSICFYRCSMLNWNHTAAPAPLGRNGVLYRMKSHFRMQHLPPYPPHVHTCFPLLFVVQSNTVFCFIIFFKLVFLINTYFELSFWAVSWHQDVAPKEQSGTCGWVRRVGRSVGGLGYGATAFLLFIFYFASIAEARLDVAALHFYVRGNNSA